MHFEELITEKQLVLVQLSMWDGPYVNFILKIEVDCGNGEIVSLNDLNRTWHGTDNVGLKMNMLMLYGDYIAKKTGSS